MSTTDQDLLHQISLAQVSALSSLYDRYHRLVFSLALRITGSAGAAEEITQDVFVQIWRNAASYNPSLGKVVTWLTSITRYRSIDRLRRQSSRVDGSVLEDALEDLETSTVPQALPEQQVERRANELRVQQALAELPKEQRLVLILAYFQGMSQPEMAAALNQPIGTIKTRVRLGLLKLRELLAEEELVDE